MPVFCRPLSNVPSYAFPPRAFPACRFAHYMSLRPPRRLSPRFPRRFSHRLLIAPSTCRLFRLHTVRAAFSERPSCRSRDVVTVRSVPARRLHMPAYIAFGYRIVPRNRHNFCDTIDDFWLLYHVRYRKNHVFTMMGKSIGDENRYHKQPKPMH